METLINTLVRFIGMSARGKASASAFSQVVGVVVRTVRSLAGGITALISMALGPLGSALGDIGGFFMNTMKNAIGFDLSINGLLEEAERARSFFSELRDELNFYSSATGSTTNAVNILMEATGKSLATHQALKQTFSSMVDAGADSDEFIKDMLPTLGEFELKTGLAANQFGLLSTKFQQMLSEKKGIGKDIKALQKAMIGTGLKGAQLEQTMQGLTEVTEKLAFATRGATLDIKELGNNYSATVAVFKAFGISAQSTTNFINNLLDPENMEKNMLLMSKMSISYEEFNEMLNSGRGQEKFFDKILSNVGKVGREAANIEDAATRYRYLKDTLNLPPEIANKLMKVPPNKMQSELRKIKKEMEEAEKKDKWRKDLKAKEEKYEEEMRFLRMQMVQPLVDLITGNRRTMMDFLKAIKPVIKGLAEMLKTFMMPLDNWFSGFSDDLAELTKNFKYYNQETKNKKITDFIRKQIPLLWQAISDAFMNLWNSPEMQQIVIPMINIIGTAVKASLIYVKELVLNDDANINDIYKDIEKKRKQKSRKEWGLDDYGNIAKDIIDQDTKTTREFMEYMEYSMNNSGKISQDKIDEIDKVYQEYEQAIISYRKAKGEEDIAEANKQAKLIEENRTKLYKTIKDKQLQDLAAGRADSKEMLNKMADSFINTYKNEEEKGFAQLKTNLGLSTPEKLNENAFQAPKINKTVSQATDLNAGKISAMPQTSENDIKKIAEAIMADPKLKEYILTSVISGTKLRINTLNNELMAINYSIDDTKKSSNKLVETINNLEKNSVVGILTNWGKLLFGEQEDSIKMLLSSINMNITSINLTNKKSGTINASGGKYNFTELENFSSYAKKGSSVLGRSTSLIDAASGSTVKNVQSKQALYLKSIANSTFDSATLLKYVGKNLIFTNTGLAVTIGNKTAKLYTLDGKEATIASGSGATNIYGLGETE